MTNKGHGPKRASRYKVPNNERVVLAIENENMTGSLCVLSVTGGTIRLPKRLASGTLAEMKMKTVSGPITSVIELLQVRTGAQAFRFVHFDRDSKSRLEEALKKLRAQGLGDDRKASLQNVINFAKRLLPGKG